MEIICVGGGISGLATAYALEQQAAERGLDVHVRVLERDPRLGGKVDTRQISGFTVERGVNGWLDSKPSTEALCGRLGIAEQQRLASNDVSRRRFVFRHGRLHKLPETPGAFFRSRLLSVRGRLRIIGELWAKGPPPGDETLADFARRRLGSEALEALLDPMVSGVFAGDPERMSLKSCFPRIAEVELQYGGLIRGMMKIQKERARERKAGKQVRSTSAAGPGGRLISMVGGTSALIEGLRQALRVDPKVGCEVCGLAKTSGGGYRLRLVDGSHVEADRVVLATPAWSTARIVAELDNDLAAELSHIPYAALSVVALAWRQEQMPHPLDAFGFLIPHAEQRQILGTLFDSSVFEHRAPDGLVLTRSMIGGMRRGDLALRSEEELVASAREELGSILGVSAPPSFLHVARHERAVPQYIPGHADRVARIDALKQAHRGLYLTGNAYRGIGLNDCTAQAELVAAQVLDDLSSASVGDRAATQGIAALL